MAVDPNALSSTDSGGLDDFGYKESLDRSIGKFASFAAGVSYISILTGTFQLFYFGYGTAGPAYLWSWPIVFVGQMAVALCFMELAAKYPIAGAVYNWSKMLASRIVEYRTAHNGFTSVDQLHEVKGLGGKTGAELLPLVRVG